MVGWGREREPPKVCIQRMGEEGGRRGRHPDHSADNRFRSGETGRGVLLSIYIYIYMVYVCVHVHIHWYIYVYIHGVICVCVYMCTYVYCAEVGVLEQVHEVGLRRLPFCFG